MNRSGWVGRALVVVIAGVALSCFGRADDRDSIDDLRAGFPEQASRVLGNESAEGFVATAQTFSARPREAIGGRPVDAALAMRATVARSNPYFATTWQAANAICSRR